MPHNFSVLIIEDDADARTNVEDILSLDGYQTASVGHCLPALEAINRRHFDAVIVDWRLPDGNGGDLIPAIKERLPDSPVVVVTGLREFDTAVKALRRGAYDFLTKPINPDALRSLLRRLVERKRHLSEIDAAQMKMMENERLAAIGQMVAGLAHESRNVLQRSHACLAELSLDVRDMPESLKLVEKVQKALDDLNGLLEEVREYSAPINLEKRNVNPEQLVQTAIAQISDAKQIPENISINVRPGTDLLETISIDESKLTQVLRNLLENAIHASPSLGEVVINIKVNESSNSKSTISFTVIDEGNGVPEEDRESIFTPFFTTKTKGTGLGLAISRRIVDAHGGSLIVTDGPNGGAAFVLEVPLNHGKRRER
ncbi:MAG: ATP-binding protein [Planctomycetota bacterium]